MKNERLPTTLTGFMALMDADGDVPLGVIQALLDEVAALTAENARLADALKKADKQFHEIKLIAERATIDEPVWSLPNSVIWQAGIGRTEISAALRALTEQP